MKIFFSETTEQNSLILHTNSPWVCVVKVCSNGGATCTSGKVLVKNNLDIDNFNAKPLSLLLQNYCTEFLDNNSQKNLNIANLIQTSENLLLQNLLNRILRHCTLIFLGYV